MRQDHVRAAPARQMNGLAWLFCLLIICQAGFEWSYGYQAAEFLNKAGGVSKGTAATLMTVFYAGMVVCRFGLIRAVRRFAASHLLTASFAMALVGFLLLAGGPTTGIKVAGLLVSGFGIAITFPMIITLAARGIPGRDRLDRGKALHGWRSGDCGGAICDRRARRRNRHRAVILGAWDSGRTGTDRQSIPAARVGGRRRLISRAGRTRVLGLFDRSQAVPRCAESAQGVR